MEEVLRGFEQTGGAHFGRVGEAIERATGRRRLARSTRDESANHNGAAVCFCIIAQKHMRSRAGQRPPYAAPCSGRSTGGRPRTRPWRTWPPLRGFYWSAWPGARRPRRPRGLRLAASTVAATEAAGTPTTRFLLLLLPFSSLEKLVQTLNKGCIKNLVATASSNSNVALEDTTIRKMVLLAPQGGVKGQVEKVV